MSAHDEIARLITIYAHLLDDRRFDELGGLWAEDAVMSVGERELHGRAQITDSIKGMQSGGWGKHLTTTPVIDLEGEDTAFAWTDMVVAMPGEAGIAVTSMFRYHDKVTRVDGRWLFARRDLHRPGEQLRAGTRPEPER